MTMKLDSLATTEIELSVAELDQVDGGLLVARRLPLPFPPIPGPFPYPCPFPLPIPFPGDSVPY